MNERNELLETIKEELKFIYIQDGRPERFESICNDLEKAISKKILSHEIDYYTEELKL